MLSNLYLHALHILVQPVVDKQCLNCGRPSWHSNHKVRICNTCNTEYCELCMGIGRTSKCKACKYKFESITIPYTIRDTRQYIGMLGDIYPNQRWTEDSDDDSNYSWERHTWWTNDNNGNHTPEDTDDDSTYSWEQFPWWEYPNNRTHHSDHRWIMVDMGTYDTSNPDSSTTR